MFLVKLKPALDNKQIFNAENLRQRKIKFEPNKHERDPAQCAKWQRYGHTKKFCHLKPRCVKWERDHSTGEKGPVMSHMFCVEETILRIIKDMRSTQNCIKRNTHGSE
jgi:hypothetical protein